MNVRYYGRLKGRQEHVVGRRGRILMVELMVQIKKPQAGISS